MSTDSPTDDGCSCNRQGTPKDEGVRHDIECPFGTPVPAIWKRFGS